MKAEKTSGAKFALYNAGAAFDTFAWDRQCAGIDANRATLNAASYIVAVGERLLPQPDAVYIAVYITADGEETTDPTGAMAFDTYADALKWAVEHCEISDIGYPVPRGFERPRYPRVCYLREYVEITEC